MSEPSFMYAGFKHEIIIETLWMSCWCTPFGTQQDLSRRESSLSISEPCLRRDIDSSSESVQLKIPDEAAAFVSSLRACTKNKDLYQGTCLHNDILKRGLLKECSDALITMYAKCGELSKAQGLLDVHKSRDVIPWTALIAGYAREGRGHIALDCFDRMRHEGIWPNAVTYICILKACATIKCVERGISIHDEIEKQGLLENNTVLGTALLDMYAKCGALSRAHDVLEKLSSPDVVSWSALIAGYAQEGQGEQALDCFERMQRKGIRPNKVTYLAALKACATLRSTQNGKRIHDEIARQGLLQDHVMLGNALVDMYAKCGALSKAQDVLEKLPVRNVVTWSALITGYVQGGLCEEALSCFELMQHEGISPDVVTYLCILKACAATRALNKGKQIHDEIVLKGLLQHNLELGSALVDMYAKCGAVLKAQEVLEKLPFCNVFAWSALIEGYAQEGQGDQALECFEHMQSEDIRPDAVTYLSVLKACAFVQAIDKGKEVHEEIVRKGLLQDNVVLGNALVDMYVKCGALSKAQAVIEKLTSRDAVTWSTIIAGYAQEGQGEQVLGCFEHMQHEGISPNAVTFVSVLNACSHLGLLEKGYAIFVDMAIKHGIVEPKLECYMCMVDLFGRAGHLQKAVQLIQEMPSFDYPAVWLALLGACRKWGEVDVGRWAFERAIQVDESNSPAYVLMADIYAAADMQDNANNIQALGIRNQAWEEEGVRV